MRHALVLSFALVGLVACKNNPVEGKTMAQVAEPPRTADSVDNSAPMSARMIAPMGNLQALGALSQPVALAINSENSKLSFVGAKVTGKHNGSFGVVGGTLSFARTIERSKLTIDVDVASLKTDGGDKLDGHLKSADFFDVAKFPKATFVSDKIVKDAEGKYTITGVMDLHGVKKQLSFPATGETSPEFVSLKSEFGLSRKDFGVVYPGKPNDLIKDEILLVVEMKLPRPAKQ